MSAARAHIEATPRAPRRTWSRLALLVAVLAATSALAALVIAWLVPSNQPSRTATYPLADIEVGVPKFYRPFNMGWDPAGEPAVIWLVRQDEVSVGAFWSRPAHPSACTVVPTPVTVGRTVIIPRGAASTATATPSARPGFPRPIAPIVLGFRDPCLSSTFLLDGSRNFGPPPRGLDSFRTTIEGGAVTIDVGRFILGDCGGYVSDRCSTPEHQRTRRATWPFPVYR